MHRRGIRLDAGSAGDRRPNETMENAACFRRPYQTRAATDAAFPLRDADETATKSGSRLFSLRHEHDQAFARATSFDELGHRKLMAVITTLVELGDKFRRALRQHDVALEHDSITTKMHGFFWLNINQFTHMIADRALAVVIKGGWEPDAATVRQWTETSIEMIKARIDKFD